MAGWWDTEGLTGKIVRKGMEVTGGVGPGASGPKDGPKKYTRKDLAKIGRDRYLGGKHILTGKELSSGREDGRKMAKYGSYDDSEFKDYTNVHIDKILKQGKLA